MSRALPLRAMRSAILQMEKKNKFDLRGSCFVFGGCFVVFVWLFLWLFLLLDHCPLVFGVGYWEDCKGTGSKLNHQGGTEQSQKKIECFCIKIGPVFKYSVDRIARHTLFPPPSRCFPLWGAADKNSGTQMEEGGVREEGFFLLL